MRVLAITRDTAFLRALRVDMPLLNLKRQGLIEDYHVTNPSLFDVPSDFPIDVVWLQRICSSRLLHHLSKVIGDQYLYDLDDLLIGSAPYNGRELIDRKAVEEAVRCCSVLTVTSHRLIEALEKYVGSPVRSKSVVCPNGFEFTRQTRLPSRPAGIVVASTDEFALKLLKHTIADVIAKFSAKYHLPVYCFGPVDREMLSKCEQAIFFGLVPFWHFHVLLAAFPPLIGIAPLEVGESEDLQDFLACKSDVKMLTYSGFGHPSVYSKVPCFEDTELKAGVLVQNIPDDWAEGLEAMYSDGWKRLAAEQEHTIAARHMDRIAAQSWLPALLKAKLPEPVPASRIKFSLRQAGFLLNAARHLIYSQDHIARRSMREQMPSLLLRLAKRTLLD